MLIVDKHCSDVCEGGEGPSTFFLRIISTATDWSQSKQVKEHSDTDNFICNQYGEKLAILDT